MRQYEDFSILWFDEETNRNADILYFKDRVNYRKVFTCFQSCTNLIYALKQEKFFVIFSGSIHPFLINIFLEFPQVIRLYILPSINGSEEEKGDDNYDKEIRALVDKHSDRLCGPFVEKLTLFAQLLHDAKSMFDSVHTTCPFSVFDANVLENTLCDVTNNKSLFLWSQLLVEILLHMDDADEAKTDMSFTSRYHYHDNANVLKTIAGFAEDYQPEMALHWYTKNSFVFRLINKALRTQDIDIIMKFRFFIKDLHNQLVQMHEIYKKMLEQSNKTEFTVYRGQMINANELITLQNNINNVMSTNSFFSTSSNSSVACDFAGDGSGRPLYESVLLQIHVRTNIKTKPYAKVGRSSVMNDEDEIVFSLGTMFSIDSVELLTDTLWLVDISLIKQPDQDLQDLFDGYKMDIEKSSSDHLTLGIFLTHIGEYVRATHYYNILLVKPNLDPNILVCVYYNLAMVCCEQGLYDEAMKHLEKCTIAYLLYYPNTAYNYAENIVLLRHINTEKSEFNFRQNQDFSAERTLEEHLPYIQDPVVASSMFSQLAYIYHKTGKSSDARRMLENSVNIDKTLLDDIDFKWGIYRTYDHFCRSDYAAALDEYQHFFSTVNALLPSKQPMLAIVHYNMGDLLFLNSRTDAALSHYNISLDIRRFCLPSQHPLLPETLDRIESIRNSTLNIERVKSDCLMQIVCFPRPLMAAHLASVLKDLLSHVKVSSEIISAEMKESFS
jgi:tetratricopeptide (TPR) repeat protein